MLVEKINPLSDLSKNPHSRFEKTFSFLWDKIMIIENDLNDKPLTKSGLWLANPPPLERILNQERNFFTSVFAEEETLNDGYSTR